MHIANLEIWVKVSIIYPEKFVGIRENIYLCNNM